MANTVELTEGGKPLPSVTTWDRFYQAALRARIIVEPIYELVAVNMAQELALEDGFQLYAIPATESQWFRGKGARKPQALWFSYLTRMGLQVVDH